MQYQKYNSSPTNEKFSAPWRMTPRGWRGAAAGGQDGAQGGAPRSIFFIPLLFSCRVLARKSTAAAESARGARVSHCMQAPGGHDEEDEGNVPGCDGYRDLGEISLWCAGFFFFLVGEMYCTMRLRGCRRGFFFFFLMDCDENFLLDRGGIFECITESSE